MNLQTQNIPDDTLDILRHLSRRQNELIALTGQTWLEIKDAKKQLHLIKSEFEKVNSELENILSELKIKYPNGEIDLNTGMVTY
jgi:hypothetical protein